MDRPHTSSHTTCRSMRAKCSRKNGCTAPSYRRYSAAPSRRQRSCARRVRGAKVSTGLPARSRRPRAGVRPAGLARAAVGSRVKLRQGRQRGVPRAAAPRLRHGRFGLRGPRGIWAMRSSVGLGPFGMGQIQQPSKATRPDNRRYRHAPLGSSSPPENPKVSPKRQPQL